MFVVLLAAAAALTVGTSDAVHSLPGADTAPGLRFFAWPPAYLALNLLYSYWGKHVVVVDCMCIAVGFQVRMLAGAAAIAVETSHWISLCTFFFALFLAFCKRYEELGRQTEATGQTRATMGEYTAPFLSMMIGPLAGFLLTPLFGIGTINTGDFSGAGLLISLLGAVILLAVVNLVRRGAPR